MVNGGLLSAKGQGLLVLSKATVLKMEVSFCRRVIYISIMSAVISKNGQKGDSYESKEGVFFTEGVPKTKAFLRRGIVAIFI